MPVRLQIEEVNCSGVKNNNSRYELKDETATDWDVKCGGSPPAKRSTTQLKVVPNVSFSGLVAWSSDQQSDLRVAFTFVNLSI